jgi:hypothetical protein
MQVLLWSHLQQPVSHIGMQEQLQVCCGQEEQDRLQGMSPPQVSHGWHVQVRVQIRKEVKLVQNPLPHAATTWSQHPGSQPPKALSSGQLTFVIITESHHDAQPLAFTAQERKAVSHHRSQRDGVRVATFIKKPRVLFVRPDNGPAHIGRDADGIPKSYVRFVEPVQESLAQPPHQHRIAVHKD